MKRVVLVLGLLSGCAGSTTGSTADAAVAAIPDAGRACERLDSGTNCVAACDEGNDRHVGEYCTRGGGECDDNNAATTGNAIICTVDFDETAPAFCTKPCQQDSQCGTGATCQMQPDGGGQSGCVPNQCL